MLAARHDDDDDIYIYIYICNILTSDSNVDQGIGASSRRYQGITLTVDGLN